VLGYGCARLLDRAIPRLRQTAYVNLGMALPDADPKAITDEVFRSIGRLLVTFSRFPRIRSELDKWIRYEGLEYFHEAKRRGRGVLFATGHFGNWELSAFAHGILMEPMHVVVRPLDNPWIDRLVESRRTLGGNRVIQKKDASRWILRALARNEAVGILVDQNAAPEEGIFAGFFGIPACAGTAFARIANRTGAAVIIGFALWSEVEKKYVLRFQPFALTGDDEADTGRLHAELETAIRACPGQWLWIHRRWKTRPPGEPPIY
jgi:KDO2-lipid IV(A) lauroyltransferase